MSNSIDFLLVISKIQSPIYCHYPLVYCSHRSQASGALIALAVGSEQDQAAQVQRNRLRQALKQARRRRRRRRL